MSNGIVMKTQLNLEPLRNYARNLQPGAREAVRITTYMVRDDMYDNAPRDTGALAEGIYVVTKNENGYADAAARAAALRPGVIQLPSIPGTNSDYLSKIGFTQPYWEHVEYGTFRMESQPFVRPAVEKGRKWFPDVLRELLSQVASKSGWST